MPKQVTKRAWKSLQIIVFWCLKSVQAGGRRVDSSEAAALSRRAACGQHALRCSDQPATYWDANSKVLARRSGNPSKRVSASLGNGTAALMALQTIPTRIYLVNTLSTSRYVQSCEKHVSHCKSNSFWRFRCLRARTTKVSNNHQKWSQNPIKRKTKSNDQKQSDWGGQQIERNQPMEVPMVEKVLWINERSGRFAAEGSLRMNWRSSKVGEKKWSHTPRGLKARRSSFYCVNSSIYFPNSFSFGVYDKAD